ncbi:MAG: asparagine synthase (glutamine-hydrolyzing) [Magnetococcales bacterium]|nr:asparagine synthase (glutamine-hydrolyzing) [Magnetococcales bacterium]NGZ05112.1 asparagine synthase (glutamine-hydrolyzing) [Magnetococcales bacterium]
MCGIGGIIGTNCQSPEKVRILTDMMRSMAHRGPDGEGQDGDEYHVFGHRRLAIIDLEHGHQPMLSNDGNLVLVYNGEIYNYQKLRQQLLIKGVRFRTFSDTEVLLKLLEAHGSSGLHRLNGMFAFALYNKQERYLLCARDPFGIKPLYYTVTSEGELLFASEIKALFFHPALSVQLNQTALFEYLTFQFCLEGSSLFQGIHAVPPGHTLEWRHGWEQPRIQRYWTVDYTINDRYSEDYAVDHLILLLQDSVRQQLVSDVPVGCYLSGGLDSGVVTSLSAMHLAEGLHAFHGRFTETPSYDESHHAQAIADQYSIDLHVVTPTAKQFVDLLPGLIHAMDEPAAGPGLFPQYLVSKAAREHVTVILSGLGGDELFGGYARYLVAYLEQCLKGEIFETREEGRHILTLESIITNLPLLRQYVPMLQSFWQEGLFAAMDRRYFRLVDRCHLLSTLLHADLVSQYDPETIFGAFRDIFHRAATGSYLNKMTAFDQVTLLPALLQVEDRVSMAVSLESRVPLLDTRLAAMAATIPPRIKYKNGELKYIFRHAVRNLLPPSVMQRKDKMGFPVPLNEWWHAGQIREFVLDTLLSERCLGRGIFDRHALTRLLEAKNFRFDRQVWGVLSLEIWFQQFFDGYYASKRIVS